MRELPTVEEAEYQRWVDELASSSSLGSYEALRNPAEFVPATKRERKKKPYIHSDQKRCPKCKCDRLRKEFIAQPKKRDGLSSWCRDCLRLSKSAKRAMDKLELEEYKMFSEEAVKLIREFYSIINNYPYWDEDEVTTVLEKAEEFLK